MLQVSEGMSDEGSNFHLIVEKTKNEQQIRTSRLAYLPTRTVEHVRNAVFATEMVGSL